jgi:hypothetical protein
VAGIEQVRDAIKVTLETAISGLTVYDTAGSVTNLPAVVVIPRTGQFEPGEGVGVDDTYLFDLDVLCSATVPRIGQDSLDALITGVGGRSIRQAVNRSRNTRGDALGLVNCKAWVRGWGRYGTGFDGAGINHVGAVVRLEVVTSAA